ncbi:MAG TPA: M23 family metallopeptidase [Solimonas sp.]|nr:M23 family metallopeptidase [Solimonas sp.]
MRVFLALLLVTALAPASALELRGEWRQGSVLFGHAEPGTRVWFNGRELKLTEGGEFVFGLDRDESAEAELRVQAKGEPLPETFRYQVKKREYQIQHLTLPPTMVNPPAAVLARIREEQEQVGEARRRVTGIAAFTGGFVWPCLGRISGVFGSQRILNGEPKQPHYGVDVAVPSGTPVRAPAGGVISLAHPDMYYTGGTLMIDHGHGLSSAFLHLSKLLVKSGDTVRQGDTIALSGATGRATGPHLDWRVSWINARVDAALLVPPMPEPEHEEEDDKEGS